MTLTTDIAEAIKCAGSDPQVLAAIAVKVVQERQVNRDELIEAIKEAVRNFPNSNRHYSFAPTILDAILSDCPELGVQAQGFDELKWLDTWVSEWMLKIHKDISDADKGVLADNMCCDWYGSGMGATIKQSLEDAAGQAQGAAKVVVKGLVWEYDAGWHSTGDYEIQGSRVDDAVMFSYRGKYCRTVFKSVDLCKAAAQAHHEALVLSQIEETS